MPVSKLQSHIVLHQCLTDVTTPLQLFNTLSHHCKQAVLLESTDADTRLARFSFLAWRPYLSFTVKDKQATLINEHSKETTHFTCEDPWAWMRETQSEWLSTQGWTPERLKEDLSLPALGGWFGYTGYNAVQHNEAIPQQVHDPLNVPDIAYGFYSHILVFDHLTRILSSVSLLQDSEANARIWGEVCHALESPFPLKPLPLLEGLDSLDPMQGVETNMSRENFLAKVLACKALIEAGEVFQIVLAQCFSIPYLRDPLNAYRALVSLNPSPYAYILKYDGFWYLGSSPETFVEVSGDTVLLRALAGTRKRGKTQADDQRLAAELQADVKELAEHKMLVDLGRNDLGRVCEVNTIQVGQLAEVHYYTHVMHLATEIKGRKSPQKDAFDVFRTVLPRGTVSGAPKIRAMQHLATLEPSRRGIYAGAVGYFDVKGNLQSCIAIRSALIKNQVAYVQAGAGIVHDSIAEHEYLETLNKARSMLVALYWASHPLKN
jgi:anthranilate synthase component 1